MRRAMYVLFSDGGAGQRGCPTVISSSRSFRTVPDASQMRRAAGSARHVTSPSKLGE